ncbi:phosphomannomutase [Pararhizobium sp.]|uniref:phosphomannomutase n=1 Tax=Pararhizobium sp. TaxID=1977563 RepID=UPI00272912FE|nr:phosphomannomutase [Pararhizobium sp.]MDO9416458.1 phosphomannomutase [Pararhizobium sp.]
MSLKFGTSGLRGLSVDLMGTASALYSEAFARHLRASGLAQRGDTILVGRDFRPSSPEIAAVCMGALERAGLVPADCGTLPTPALALYGLQRKAASLMITGSHIPADRNGIKFYRPDGEIDKTDEAAISASAAGIVAAATELSDTPGTGPDLAAETEALFFARNVNILKKGALSGLTIGVYQHSSVARDLFVDVLEAYGATAMPLGRSETFIPVDTEAVSADTIGLLHGWAREHRLDAIVSADGDGDRPLVTDETGLPLRGDLIGLMTANFLGAQRVVTPVTSNSCIEGAGSFAVTRTKVGSPFVIAGMAKALASGEEGVMGFEANGGVLTASPFTLNGVVLQPLPTRDCFLPVLAVLSRLADEKQPLSKIAAGYGLPVALSDRLENFAVENSQALMSYLRASPENLALFLKGIGEPAAISDIDGLRVTLSDKSILHFRPSGNAPEMRCYVEAADQTAGESLMAKGLAAIRDWRPT